MGRRTVGCKSRECGQGIVRERNTIVGDGGCLHCEDEGDVLGQVGVGPLAGAGHDEHALHRPHPEVCARHGRRERRQRVRYLQSARVPKSARDADGARDVNACGTGSLPASRSLRATRTVDARARLPCACAAASPPQSPSLRARAEAGPRAGRLAVRSLPRGRGGGGRGGGGPRSGRAGLGAAGRPH